MVNNLFQALSLPLNGYSIYLHTTHFLVFNVLIMLVTEPFVQVKYDIAHETMLSIAFLNFSINKPSSRKPQFYTAGILLVSVHCDKTSLTSATGVLTS